MKLSDIDLCGLGSFTDSECGFRINRYHLEEPWGYIYATREILLRVDQRGPDYVQFTPPTGTVLIRRERYQKHPSLLVWIRTENGKAFTNFWNPVINFDATREPGEFHCEYDISSATYHVAHEGLAVDSELIVALNDPVVILACRVSNNDIRKRTIEIIPLIRPHFAAASLAPWDVPSLYQTVAYSNDIGPLFEMELRSPAGIPEERKYGFVLVDINEPDSAEVDYARFIGNGSFEHPEFTMTVPARELFRFGERTAKNACQGVPCVAAISKTLSLEPGESFELSLAIGTTAGFTEGKKPTRTQVERLRRYLDSSARQHARESYASSIRASIEARRIASPDAAFSRYVNEWLPLQLRWVNILDRGWPTGMRGTRDSAQDTTALIPINPDEARSRICELFCVQRYDGWFPRQYSIMGPRGTHDLRFYVDAGAWVWELLFDYLRWTKDFKLLKLKVPFLDSTKKETVLDHALRIAEFYTARKNLGEHGLCKIREGDWNDSINRAGLEGRGESVMLSCQVVLLLKQAAYLLEWLDEHTDLVKELRRQAQHLTSSILRHALNDEGYLNGVFTDKREWVFSPSDPDGRRRISIPVNAWGIISGVLTGESCRRVIEILAELKQQDGWPLFTPPIGDPPIEKLGRIGQGDLLPGLGENGTPYNHGCHGFLGRAAACAKRGDLLFEVLRYMLPYDQTCHPVKRAKTPPYAVVNHWKTAPGLEGRGGDPFLTGSISTALRNVYDALFGIKPLFDCIAFDPCLPTNWSECSTSFYYLRSKLDVKYRQTNQDEYSLFLDGEPVEHKAIDWFGQTLTAIPDSALLPKRHACIEVTR
ncbi:MAG: hypothetical protein QHI38_00650 [Armatimonadota bacterium]|nr:hypothetical protein [Armatimonadota bacterium]